MTTTSQLRNKNVGNPGNGGSFAAHGREEASVSLTAGASTPLVFSSDRERAEMEAALDAVGKTGPGTKEFRAAYRLYHLATAGYEKAAGVVDGVHPPKDLDPRTIASASAVERETWARHPETAIRLAVASNPRTRMDTVRSMYHDRDFHVQDAVHLRLHGVVNPGNENKRQFEARTGRRWGS